jgi:hypothetical protein
VDPDPKKPRTTTAPSSRPTSAPATTGQRLGEGLAGYAGALAMLPLAALALRMRPHSAAGLLGTAFPLAQLGGMFAGMHHALGHNAREQIRGYEPVASSSQAPPDVEALARANVVRTPPARLADGTLNPASRTYASAVTAAHPPGSVGSGAHGAISTMHGFAGNLFAHDIGHYFGHPFIQHQLSRSDDGANETVASGEHRYWTAQDAHNPSPGTKAGAAADVRKRKAIQRFYAQKSLFAENMPHLWGGDWSRRQPPPGAGGGGGTKV